MKRILGLIIALLAGLTAIRAMSYEEARDRARFLTDKMAYELNLNEQQYNDAYEINLDYLMNIRTESDIAGVYLEHRNADIRCILYDWQYALFQAATYFFRPVLWRATGWFLPVYTVYKPTLFYYDPPRVFRVYRGGHYAYRHEHRVSFYAHRRPAWHGGLRGESRGPAPDGQPRRPGDLPRQAAPASTSNPPTDRDGPDSRHGNRTTTGNRASGSSRWHAPTAARHARTGLKQPRGPRPRHAPPEQGHNRARRAAHSPRKPDGEQAATRGPAPHGPPCDGHRPAPPTPPHVRRRRS